MRLAWVSRLDLKELYELGLDKLNSKEVDELGLGRLDSSRLDLNTTHLV